MEGNQMKNRKKWRVVGLLVALSLLLATTALAHGHGGGHHGRHHSQAACAVEACVFADADGDGICDHFAAHQACVDADGDGVCDWRCEGYADADGDGFCDHCGRAHAREDCGYVGRGHGCRRG